MIIHSFFCIVCWSWVQRTCDDVFPVLFTHTRCTFRSAACYTNIFLFDIFSSGKDDVLDIEIDSYIHCISAFVKLAQSEYALLMEIIPEHHQKKTFDSLIQVKR